MLFQSFLNLSTIFQYHAILFVAKEHEWREFSAQKFYECLEKICQVSFKLEKNDPFSETFYHPDILIVDRKRAKLRLEDIRDIRDFCLYPPQIAKKRLVFIEHCDRLNINSANSLLKLLEEPHKDIVFLFTTAHKHLILKTILSRMQVFHLTFEQSYKNQFLEQFDEKTQKFFQEMVYALKLPKSASSAKLSTILTHSEQMAKQYSAAQLRDLFVYWVSDRLKKDQTFVIMARFIMAQLRDWRRVEPLNPSSQFWLVRIFLGQFT